MLKFLAAMFSFVGLTKSYPDGVYWKLAYNIHGSDGHNFGYQAEEWEDFNNVGNASTAFIADYKSYNVTQETANFIAVARHQNGMCEAVRIWEFLTRGKTLSQYIDSEETPRLVATEGNYTYSYISPTMSDKVNDPFFSEDGGLAFNWIYGNNGVRIANSGFFCGNGLPGLDYGMDDYWGLGNDFALGESNMWFDVGMTRCGGRMNQGTDHGSHKGYLKDRALLGQYAIYVSDGADHFPCEDKELVILPTLPIPTLSPSASPPTPSPSISPPTVSPTSPPSIKPTAPEWPTIFLPISPSVQPTTARPSPRPTVSPTLSPSATPTTLSQAMMMTSGQQKSEFNISFGMLHLLIGLSVIVISILLCFTICILCFWILQRGQRQQAKLNVNQNKGELRQLNFGTRSFRAEMEPNGEVIRDEGILANSPLAKHKVMLNDVEMASPESTIDERARVFA